MNKLLITIFSAIIGCISTHNAYAEDVKNYIAIDAGVNLPNDWSTKVNLDSSITAESKVNLDSSFHAGLKLGRQYESSRFEIEYQHGQSQVLNIGGVSNSIENTSYIRYDALTLNAFRTQSITEDISVYAGGGMGIGYDKFPGASYTDCECFSKTTGFGLTYLLRAGLEYEPMPNNYLFAQYSEIYLPQSHSQSNKVEYDRNAIGTMTIGYRKTF